MQRAQAAEVVGELKGLMPMLTEEQAHYVLGEIEQREDASAVRRAVHSYVADHEQFSVSAFRAMLPPKPGETSSFWAQETADKIARERADGEAIERQHDANKAVCDALDDATYDRVASQVMRATLEPEIVAIYARKPLRHWRSVRAMVAEYARAHHLTPSSLATLV